MSCGTTSKETGKKSKPCSRARVSSSATRASNMRHLPRLQEGLQHLKEFFLMGDGHTQQARMRDALQGILQRTGRRVGLPNPAIEARIIMLGSIVPNGRQVDAADELRNVLGFGVGRDERANAHAFFFRVKNTLDRYTINVALIMFAQIQSTQWAQLALDMHTRFCLKIIAQGM